MIRYSEITFPNFKKMNRNKIDNDLPCSVLFVYVIKQLQYHKFDSNFTDSYTTDR